MEFSVKDIRKLLLVLSAISLIVSCNLFPGLSSGYSKIDINFGGSRSIDNSISYYKLTITGSDFDDIVAESDNGSFSVEVLSGTSRTFKLQIYNSEKSLLLYEGETTIDLEAGSVSIPISVDKKYFTISYNLNGGVGQDLETISYYNSGDTLKIIDGNSLSKLGFYPSLWNSKSDGTGLETYQLGETITAPSKDLTLYAQWTNEVYTVTYDINGGNSGSVPTDNTNYISGDNASVLSGGGIFHPTLYFSSWNTKPDGSGTFYSFGDQLPINSSDITLYAIWSTFTSATFNNAGAIGRYGPTQSQINTEYSGSILEGKVTISSLYDGYQLWTVPVSGKYRIETRGAAGGISQNAGDVTGAVIIGEFTLTAGDSLVIVVGQEGETRVGDYDAGSGGGTFVVLDSNKTPTDFSDDTPLIIAGGGSGQTSDANANPGSSTQTPTGTLGAVNGLGYGGGDATGPGGGGFYTDGQNTSYPETNGLGYANGLVGGNYWGGSSTVHGVGGFGGGSGGIDENGTAGGGYTGGTGRDSASDTGGGGSFNSGTNQTNTQGTNSGNGKVVITLIP